MIKILSITLLAAMACTLAVIAMPKSALDDAVPFQPSFDIAMPAAQTPVDAGLLASTEPSQARPQ